MMLPARMRAGSVSRRVRGLETEKVAKTCELMVSRRVRGLENYFSEFSCAVMVSRRVRGLENK